MKFAVIVREVCRNPPYSVREVCRNACKSGISPYILSIYPREVCRNVSYFVDSFSYPREVCRSEYVKFAVAVREVCRTTHVKFAVQPYNPYIFFL